MNWQNTDFDDLCRWLHGEDWVMLKSPRGEVRKLRRWHPFLLQLLAHGWVFAEDEVESEQADDTGLS